MADCVTFNLPDGSSRTAIVRRSARGRRLGLRLHDDGALVLSVPSAMPLAEVQAALPRFIPWLAKRLATRATVATVPTLPDALDLPFVGQHWHVCCGGDFAAGRTLAGRARDSVQIRSARTGLRALLLEVDDTLHIFASPAVWLAWEEGGPTIGRSGPGALVPAILQRFCRIRAGQVLPPFLRDIAHRHGFVLGDVRIHDQHSRWASCSRIRSGQGGFCINLNWRGVFLSPAQFAHLCCHELCHTLHMDHSAQFHDALEAVSPGSRAAERALNDAWRALPWWARVRPDLLPA